MSIVIENLSFTYGKKTPYEKKALDGVNLTVPSGQFLGIVGATGSGKSTLIQHINGLIKLTEGKITVGEIDLSARKPAFKQLRKRIGMLFQYPEYQLFAETVLEDVMYGPRNFGMDKQEAEIAAHRALQLVGLTSEEYEGRSPLELSGGQKRRAAIAGVLSYSPDILVLDEPTAGLDPAGKREMLQLISSLRSSTVNTVIMVSHNMDEIAEYADRVVVMSGGRLIYDLPPVELFYQHDLRALGLDLPHTVKIVTACRARGIALPSLLNARELAITLLGMLGGNR